MKKWLMEFAEKYAFTLLGVLVCILIAAGMTQVVWGLANGSPKAGDPRCDKQIIVIDGVEYARKCD